MRIVLTRCGRFFEEGQVWPPLRVRAHVQSFRQNIIARDREGCTLGSDHEANLVPVLSCIPNVVRSQDVVSSCEFDERAGVSEVY